jgi:hypothetical protein
MQIKVFVHKGHHHFACIRHACISCPADAMCHALPLKCKVCDALKSAMSNSRCLCTPATSQRLTRINGDATIL